MKTFLVLPRVLAVTTALVLGAPAVAQSPLPAAAGESVADGLAEARALMEQRRFLDALKVLRPLAEAHDPVPPDALFLIGLAGIEASQFPGLPEKARDALLDASIEALRTMLIRDPGLVRARLELARAFFLQREDSLARRNFEQVLAGDLPPPVVANVQRFLREIRARRRWSMYFGAALTPDSNIGSASEERIIHILGLPFRRDAEELTTSGIGLSVWTGGEYHYPLRDRVRLRAGADLSRREYAGSEFDQTNLSVHAGPRWLTSGGTSMSVLATARRHLVTSGGDYDGLGGRFEASRRLTPRVSASVRASWHDRRYRTARSLDGPVLDLSLRGSWVATPTVRLDGSFGYGRERPGSVPDRNTSRWVRVGAQAALPFGFSVGGSGQIRWTDFEGGRYPHTPAGEYREDRTRTLSASVYHRRFTIYGFSPEVAVTHEVRDTNAQLYDYKRTSGELRFVRQF